jgi:protein gp37
MAENSKIQWTTHSWNPFRGCTKISPGCKFCYAESTSKRNLKVLGQWGPNGTRVVASESQWQEPVKWDRWAAEGKCHACGGRGRKRLLKCEECDGRGAAAGGPYRARVFCASLADVFEDWQGPMSDASGNVFIKPYLESENLPENWDTCEPETFAKDPQGWRLVTMNDVRDRLFATIAITPHLDWLLLTKRPENAGSYLTEPTLGHRVYAGVSAMLDAGTSGPLGREWDRVHELAGESTESGGQFEWTHWKLPLSNLWLGTSVEDQRRADTRIPELLKIPARVRFLSVEPMLEAIDLRFGRLPHNMDEARMFGDVVPDSRGVDWIIVGGESGSNARPFDLAWARSLRDQCREAGVAFFMKQMGENLQATNIIDPLDQFPSNGHRGFDAVPGREDTIRVHLKDKKGGEMAEWPEDLRIREFPNVEATP